MAELSQSIFATMGLPGTSNFLSIDEHLGSRECLVLIDGLGKNAIDEFGRSRSFTRDLEFLTTLKATFPSTTASSLTSLATGLSVGEHGMVGYTMRVPNSGYPERVLNALKWDDRIDPKFWQPRETLFERAAKSQINISHIAAARYASTGFTEAALRGANYISANTIQDQIAHAKVALDKPRSFAYVYLNDVDEASHSKGFGSEKFLAALGKVDELIAGLRAELPKGTRIWLTSDHGMINRDNYRVVNGLLLDGIRLMAGEPRVRYLYVEPENVNRVRETWQNELGDNVIMKWKEEAISEGLFGDSVSQSASERIGDLIAIATGNFILVEEEREALQIAMVGHHGGLTKPEVEIPLLTTVC
ncbi:MAG: alkaline phosphatase family protein [Actinomycetales bacterium]